MVAYLEEEFFKFIYKRQLIWYKRFVLKEEPPWTHDEVLKTYKIINVYRELDKCTIYLMDMLKGIRDRKTILLNIIFYRFFNQYGLYENLGIGLFDRMDKALNFKLRSSLERLKEEGKPIFNNAYLISSGTTGQKKHISILNNLQDLDIAKLIEDIDNSKTPRESLEIIQKVPMVGPFLACEIWTDLSYVDFFKEHWTDNDFVNIGPGAKWGLEIMYATTLSREEQEEKIRHLYQVQEKYLETINEVLDERFKWREIAFKGASSHYPFLSITNVEGALCEFRKYWNITHGKGRRKYFRASS